MLMMVLECTYTAKHCTTVDDGEVYVHLRLPRECEDHVADERSSAHTPECTCCASHRDDEEEEEDDEEEREEDETSSLGRVCHTAPPSTLPRAHYGDEDDEV